MIRWINDRLGTAPATDSSITEDLTILDVRDLVDKFGNSPEATKGKIEQGVALLRENKKVVVCCDYGISRSNAVAAGILARHDNISLGQAIRQVVQATGEQEIKLEPLRAVRMALQEGNSRIRDAGHRVLLTGGSGFIGKSLRGRLEKQYYVVAPPSNEVDLTVGALELDLLVKEHDINCIVHLANPRVYTSIHAIGDTVTLLRNVLEVCKENKIRLIYPSGWEVYSGYRAKDMLADEGLPLFPKGPYGEAKLLCENLIEHHRRVHDLSCCILRSSPLYGEASDRPKFIYNFIGKALRNEHIPTHHYLNGAPALDLLHVDDFVSAAIAAIEKNFVGTLNIGAGRSISTREVAEWIVKEAGSHSIVVSHNIEDYVANITMDSSQAKRQINWQPAISWEAGLSRLLTHVMKK